MSGFFEKTLIVPLVLLTICMTCGGAEQSGPSFNEGATVEVRVGEKWLAGTYVRREGRRHQVQLDGGQARWFSGESVRSSAQGESGAAASAGQGASRQSTAPQVFSLSGESATEITKGEAVIPQLQPFKLEKDTLVIRLTKAKPTDYVTPIACSTPSSTLVVETIPWPASGGTVEVSTVDLSSGAILHSGSFSAGESVLAATDNGKIIALRSKNRDKNKQIIIRSWQGKGYEPILVLGGLYKQDVNITGAAFPDVTHLFITTQGGEDYLVDLTAHQVTHRYKHHGFSTAELHASGKLFAAISGKGELQVLSLAEKPAIIMSVPKMSVSAAVSLSPSGTRVACWDRETLRVFNVADGTLVSECPLKPVQPVPMSMVDDSYVLLDHANLVDSRTGLGVWQYKAGFSSQQAVVGISTSAWGIHTQNAPVVVVARLPDAAAKEMLQSPAFLETLAMRPGAKLSVVPAGRFSEIERAAMPVLEAVAKKAGVELVAGSPVELVASVSDGTAVQRGYREVAGDSAEKNVTIRPLVYELSVRKNGQILWQKQVTSDPGMFLKAGRLQSLQSAADEASKPNAEFFSRIELPPYLSATARMNTLSYLGGSVVGEDGIGAAGR